MLLAGPLCGLGVVLLLRAVWAPGSPPLRPPELRPGQVEALREAALRQDRRSDAAALPSTQGTLAAWVALQSSAHGFDVLDLRWEPGALEGPAQRVQLALRLRGEREDLPALLDGLFGQARPLILDRLAVEAGPGERALTVTLQLHLFRPAQADPARVRELAARHLGGPLDEPQAEALEHAATLLLAERFDAATPALRAQSAQSRRRAARALPAWLLGLPRRGPIQASLALDTAPASAAEVL